VRGVEVDAANEVRVGVGVRVAVRLGVGVGVGARARVRVRVRGRVRDQANLPRPLSLGNELSMRTMSPLSFEMMRPVCRSTSSGAVHRPSNLPPSVQWLYTSRRSAAPQSGSGSEAEKHLD
jgi:hypothetical protein